MTTIIITEARIAEIARMHSQYEAYSEVITLRGCGVFEFARALLAEHESANAERVTGSLVMSGPWCCEQGRALGVPVCPECSATSAAYSSAMAPVRGQAQELVG